VIEFNSFFANEPNFDDLLARQMRGYKTMLQHLSQILRPENLRNVHPMDINTFIQDLAAIIEYVNNVDKRQLNGIIRSADGLCTVLTDVINEFSVALDLLDRVNPQDVSPSTFSEGRSSFYNRLNKCKNFIDKALKHFLI
jgi:hypothetical protein